MKYIKFPFTDVHIQELQEILNNKKTKLTKKEIDKKFGVKYIDNNTIPRKSKQLDVMMNQLLHFSKNIKMFNGISKEEIIHIVENVEFTKYPVNECALKEGVPNKKMHYIISGELSVLSQNKIVAILKTGDVFGEISAFFETKPIATLKANKPTVVISFDIIHNVTDKNSKAVAKLFKYISLGLAKKLYNANVNS